MDLLTGWRRLWSRARLEPAQTSRQESAATPYHWPIPDEAVAVHVLGEHASVRLEGGRLSVAVEGGEPALLRLDDIDCLFLHGGVALTSPATMALMRHGAPILWHGHDGRLVGLAAGVESAGFEARAAQFADAADPARSLEIARAFVDAKLSASRRLLRRRLGAEHAACRRIEALRRTLPRASSLDGLRGFEGAAADAYFAAWPELLAKAPAHLAFAGRSRRPPADPMNALLSYLYAVLQGRCTAAALAAGLEPALGFLHARRAGRHSLSLDLAEPFRSRVVDAAALAAVNNGEFPLDHFSHCEDPSEGWRLSPTGRRAALAVLERRLAQEATDRIGRRYTLRQAIVRQARDLAKAFRSGGAFRAFDTAR